MRSRLDRPEEGTRLLRATFVVATTFLASCAGMSGRRITDAPAPAETTPPAAAVPTRATAPAPATVPPPARPSDTGSRWLAPDPVGQVSVETPPFSSVATPVAAPVTAPAGRAPAEVRANGTVPPPPPRVR